MTTQATIADRNSLGGRWAPAEETNLLSDFFQTRMYSTAAGAERQTYLSSKSLLILSPEDPDYLRRFYPWSGQRLIDAAVDPEDQTYLLTQDQWVHRCKTPGPRGISDWPDTSLSLSEYMTGSFSHLEVTEALGGLRVLACWGSSGVLLLQVDEKTFRVQATLRIDETSGMLSGSEVITFIRMSNVVSMASGRILLGTKMSDGTTTELMIDVATRCPVTVWTPEAKLSPTVTTGEILIATEGVGSRPKAPEWLEPESPTPTAYTLRWTQDRPDRVAGYEVWCGRDAVAPTLYASIPSGTIRHASLRVEDGHAYRLTVRALGTSAMSAFSEEMTLTVGYVPHPPQQP